MAKEKEFYNFLIDCTQERTDYYQILEEMGPIPEDRNYTASLAVEAIRSAVEDFYKKKEKELKK